MVTRDGVIAVVGAVAILVAGWGLFVVEPRSGPFEYEVAPGGEEVAVSGSFVVHQPDAGGGGAGSSVCESPVSGVACTGHETEVRLELRGAPEVSGPVAYGGFLVGEGVEAERLGVFEAASGAFVLDASVAVDGDAFDALVVSVVERVNPVWLEGLELYRLEAPESGGEEVPVEDAFVPWLRQVSGTLVTGQAGWFEVSVLADAQLTGVTPVEGWTYQAWFVDEETGAWTALGELEVSGTTGVLESRVPRVSLEDQDRFVVTVEPDGLGPTGQGTFAAVSSPV